MGQITSTPNFIRQHTNFPAIKPLSWNKPLLQVRRWETNGDSVLYWASESATKHLWGRHAHTLFLGRTKPFLQAVHWTLQSHTEGAVPERKSRQCGPVRELGSARTGCRRQRTVYEKRKRNNKHITKKRGRTATTTSHEGSKAHSPALIRSAWLSMTRKFSELAEVGDNTLNL